MKKLMFAAAAMVAGVAMADVTSANIVGYENMLDFSEGYALVGAQLKPVAGGTAYSIQDIKPVNGCTGPAYEDADAFGGSEPTPELFVRRGGSYPFSIFYIADAYQDEDDNWQPGWVDDAAYLIEDIELALGEGYWVYDPYNATPAWTIAGEVHGQNVQSDYPTDYTLTANPFPMPFMINDASKVDWFGLKGPNYDDSDAFGGSEPTPELFIREGGSYPYSIYYLNDAYQDEDGNWQPGWVDDAAYLIEDITVPAAAGFWIVNPNEEIATVIFKR